jgi:hypothetical protein
MNRNLLNTPEVKEMIDYLKTQGFTKVTQNLKYLKKTNFDKIKALALLIERYNSKDNRKGTKYWQNAIDTTANSNSTQTTSASDDVIINSTPINYDTCEYVDDSVACVILDGNNMLFVEKEIRTLFIKKKTNLAQQLLINLSIEFCNLFQNVNNLIIFFDSTDLKYDSEDIRENNITINNNKLGLKIKLISARPNYKTSDDALVEFASSGQINLDSSLFVTSDKGLIQRLQDKNVKFIMRSGKWFNNYKLKLVGSSA